MSKPAQSEIPPIEPLPAAPETTAPPSDLFDDLNNLLLPQNFAEIAGVKKLLRTVPVRKPNKQDFIRVHPDPAFRGDFPMIELKDDREEYLIAGSGLAGELASEIVNKTLYTAINRQAVVFLWPVRLPSPDGKDLLWNSSAREAASEAIKTWIRVSSNMSLGAYEIIAAEGITTEPKWPEVSFQGLLRIAFRDRVITSLDHPVVKRLQGLM